MCRGQQKGRRRGREKPPGKGGNPMRTQTFGIEMETTGLGRERTAKAIAAYFGTEAVYHGRHCIEGAQSRSLAQISHL